LQGEKAEMKMRRIVSAESKAGVVMQASDLLDARTADLCTNIWGFDKIPDLPLAPEQVLGGYNQRGIFGPKDGVRVNVISLAPEKGGKAPDLGTEVSKIDLGTGANMSPSEYGSGGMHRTDSIDLGVVLKGETDIDYPGEDGQVHTVTVREGDFIAQNGAYHEWRNRSNDYCVILIFIVAAERKVG
jgi:hypothetical protein